VADAPIARARVIADEDLEALPRIRRRGYGLAEDTAAGPGHNGGCHDLFRERESELIVARERFGVRLHD